MAKNDSTFLSIGMLRQGISSRGRRVKCHKRRQATRGGGGTRKNFDGSVPLGL